MTHLVLLAVVLVLVLDLVVLVAMFIHHFVEGRVLLNEILGGFDQLPQRADGQRADHLVFV